MSQRRRDVDPHTYSARARTHTHPHTNMSTYCDQLTTSVHSANASSEGCSFLRTASERANIILLLYTVAMVKMASRNQVHDKQRFKRIKLYTLPVAYPGSGEGGRCSIGMVGTFSDHVCPGPDSGPRLPQSSQQCVGASHRTFVAVVLSFY